MTDSTTPPHWPFLAGAAPVLAFGYLPDAVFWVLDHLAAGARRVDDAQADFGGGDE